MSDWGYIPLMIFKPLCMLCVQVPRSQVLYALNGQVVALGQVRSKEVGHNIVTLPGAAGNLL